MPVRSISSQVDNVPALLAYTIGFFSYMSNGGTTAYETATQNVEPYTFGLSTGQSGVLAGGLSLYGSQGTWSPLKTLIALRRAFSTGGDTRWWPPIWPKPDASATRAAVRNETRKRQLYERTDRQTAKRHHPNRCGRPAKRHRMLQPG